MSGSVAPTQAPVAGPFSDAELTDIRRFLGYPASGAGNTGFQSFRYFDTYGVLEFRLANLAPAEQIVVRNYLAQLYPLETGIVGSAANLDTESAAVWRRNPTEVRDRQRLYDGWRRRFAGFIGVPPGPDLGDGVKRIVV